MAASESEWRDDENDFAWESAPEDTLLNVVDEMKGFDAEDEVADADEEELGGDEALLILEIVVKEA